MIRSAASGWLDMGEFEPAGRLFDRQVEDANGKLVGRVDDVLLDIGSGQIEYVLITLPRQDGDQPETITVPWSLIRVKTRKRRRWRIGVDKTVLERLIVRRYRP